METTTKTKLELKDVIHLYKGCKCILMGEVVDPHDEPVIRKIFTFNGVVTDSSKEMWAHCDDDEYHHEVNLSEIFLILRPMSSITDEEFMECRRIEENFQLENNGRFYGGAACIIHLLKKGFDLYKLIESKQAIDKATLNQ